MAEQQNTPANAADQDTRTRKTVRLHTIPAPPPVNIEPQKQDNVIHDPLAARDTDTGNLEILSDTQTRRTLKLKPIAPGANPAVQLNITQGDSNTNTNTRKTVLLQPVAPGQKPPAPKSIPMPPGMTGVQAPNTNTRKTAILSSSPQASAPSAADDDKTASVPRPSVPKLNLSKPVSQTASEDDKTTSIPRPVPQAVVTEKKTVIPSRPATIPRPAATQPKPAVALPKPPVAADDDRTASVPKPGTLKPSSISLQKNTAAANDDDKTTSVPRPTLPGTAVPQPKPAVTLSKPPTAAEDDRTASVPKPAVALHTPEPAKEDNDNTTSVPRPASSGSEEDDQTVKLKRPLQLTPPPPPKTEGAKATMKLSPQKPADSVQEQQEQESPKATVKLSPPKVLPKPQPQKPEEAQKTSETVELEPPHSEAENTGKKEEEKIEPVPQENAKNSSKINLDKNKVDDSQELEEEEEDLPEIEVQPPKPTIDIDQPQLTTKPSLLYLILSAVALIFILLSGTITVVQYLNLCHGKNFYSAVPGLPVAK